MALPETGRRVATMYDKLAANCLAFVKLAQSEFGCVLMSPALGLTNPLRTHILAEILDRGADTALAMRDIQRGEAGLDHAERAEDHRRVDVSHMGDAEGLVGEVADAEPEHDTAFVLAITPQRRRIGAVHQNRGDRVGALV